jgi:hypothetical protein
MRGAGHSAIGAPSLARTPPGVSAVGVDLAVQLVRDANKEWEWFKKHVGFDGLDSSDEVSLRVTYEGSCRDGDCSSGLSTGSYAERKLPLPWVARQTAQCPLCQRTLKLHQVTLAVVEGEA